MEKKKVLLTGSSGILGRNICPHLRGRFDLLAGYHNLRPSADINSEFLDITDRRSVFDIIDGFVPDVVIHLAGKNLKFCEENPGIARSVNYNGTKNLVDACTRKAVKFVFLSSDYVFDGLRGNYRENDPVNPASVYGRTKALSEAYIRKKCARYAIIRTSGIYGPGATFYDMVIKSLISNTSLEPFTDTYFTPTYVGDLSWVLCHQVKMSKVKGTFHVAGTSVVSRYEMAFMMAVILDADTKILKPGYVSRSAACIHKNTSLNCIRTMKIMGKRFLGLKEGLGLLLTKGVVG
jgi:dTDP-4-dehydrorhamnose reductase